VNQLGGLERLLSVKEITAALGCSDRALRRWIIAGRFPPADVVLGTRSLRWRESTIRAFIGGDRGYEVRPRLAVGT
jgi:predicted DNA-binding transcriptional regulator AlpA